MSGPSWRLFFALPPPLALVQAAEAYQTELLSILPGRARPVPGQNLHLTLHFCGEQPQERLAEFGEILAQLKRPPFELGLQELKTFPRFTQARVLAWQVHPCQELKDLYLELQQALAQRGLPTEARPFRPHLTLFRWSKPQPLVSLPEGRQFHWRVTHLGLYRSELFPTGPHYTCLEQVHFGVETEAET